MTDDRVVAGYKTPGIAARVGRRDAAGREVGLIIHLHRSIRSRGHGGGSRKREATR